MKHEINDFIDLNHHFSKLARDIKRVEKRAPIALLNLHLQELFDHFISDIESIAKEIYDEALLKKTSKKAKITPAELKNLIISGAQTAVEKYDETIQSRNIEHLESKFARAKPDIDSFKLLAKQTYEKQSDIYSDRYHENLKRERNEWLILCAAIIAALTGILTVIIDLWRS